MTQLLLNPGGRRRTQRWLDGSALGISALCMLHCLALPLSLSLAPALGVHLAGETEVHLWFLAAALPVSVVGLALGFRHHKRSNLIVLGTLGLLLLYAGLWSGGGIWATAVTLGGTLLIAGAHWQNWRIETRKLTF